MSLDDWVKLPPHGDQGSESMPVVPPYKGPNIVAPIHRSIEPDRVNSPSHYTAGGLEPIDMIEAKQLGYHLGNALKYICRCQFKGDRKTDVKKAIWYLERYLKTIETDGEATGNPAAPSWKDCPVCGKVRIQASRDKCSDCGGELVNCRTCGTGKYWWLQDGTLCPNCKRNPAEAVDG